MLPWMADEFIHWPKSRLLLSTTCDEILSWMDEIWMKNHLASDNTSQHCNFIISPKELQGMTNDVGLHLELMMLHRGFTIDIEQDN